MSLVMVKSEEAIDYQISPKILINNGIAKILGRRDTETHNFVLTGCVSDCLTVHPIKGVLLINDREDCSSYGNDTKLHASLYNDDKVMEWYGVVDINMENENKNRRLVLIGRIEENSLEGRKIKGIDIMKCNTVKLNIDSLPPTLRIHGNGLVTTATHIDYEVQHHIEFNLGLCHVIIIVIDVNDVQPRFTNMTYFVKVMEDSENNSNETINTQRYIATISAIDEDSSNLTYSITNRPVPFSIDSTTGRITSIAPLDREKIDQYLLHIRASDEAGSTMTSLSITVLDLNDNRPVFDDDDDNWSNMTVVINRQRYTCSGNITQIRASDADQINTQNSRITYKMNALSNTDQFNNKIISIDGNYGNISLNCYWLNRSWHINSGDVLSYNISASDHGRPSLSSDSNLFHIKIIDNSDDIFLIIDSDDGESRAVLQSSHPGTRVMKVSVCPKYQRRHFEYFIRSPTSHPFKINKYSGIVTTTTLLTYDSINIKYLIQLRACMKTSKYEREVWCTEWIIKEIQIVHYNIHQPYISLLRNNIDLYENLKKGHLVSSVTVHDDDRRSQYGSSLNSITRLVMQPTNNYLKIQQTNFSTFEIRTKNDLDCEQIGSRLSVSLVAYDLGQPRLTSSKKYLTISLIDLDDNRPYFTKPYYFISYNTSVYPTYFDNDLLLSNRQYPYIFTKQPEILTLDLPTYLHNMSLLPGTFSQVRLYPQSEQTHVPFIECPYPSHISINTKYIVKPNSDIEYISKFYPTYNAFDLHPTTGHASVDPYNHDVYITIFTTYNTIHLCRITVAATHSSKIHPITHTVSVSPPKTTFIFQIPSPPYLIIRSTSYIPLQYDKRTSTLSWAANLVQHSPVQGTGQSSIDVITLSANATVLNHYQIYINVYNDQDKSGPFPTVFHVRYGARAGLIIGRTHLSHPTTYGNISVNSIGLLSVVRGEITSRQLRLGNGEITLDIIGINNEPSYPRYAHIYWVRYNSIRNTDSVKLVPSDNDSSNDTQFRCAPVRESSVLLTGDCSLYIMSNISRNVKLNVQHHDGRHHSVNSLFNLTLYSIPTVNITDLYIFPHQLRNFSFITSLLNYPSVFIALYNSDSIVTNIAPTHHSPSSVYQIHNLCSSNYNQSCFKRGTISCTTSLIQLSSFKLYTDSFIIILPSILFTPLCLCKPFFIGPLCQPITSCNGTNKLQCGNTRQECTDTSCGIHGNCINRNLGQVHCECPLAWSGSSDCTKPLNTCDTVSDTTLCGTGRCLPRLGISECDCPYTHYGSNCQYQSIGLDAESYMEFTNANTVASNVSIMMELIGRCRYNIGACNIITVDGLFGIRLTNNGTISLNTIQQQTASVVVNPHLDWIRLVVYIVPRMYVRVGIYQSHNIMGPQVFAPAPETLVLTLTNTMSNNPASITVGNGKSHHFIGCVRQFNISSSSKSSRWITKFHKLKKSGCSRSKQLPCSDNPCNSNGHCIDEWFQVRCDCYHGYSGPNCTPGVPGYRVTKETYISLYPRLNYPDFSSLSTIFSIRLRTRQYNSLLLLAITSRDTFTLLEIHEGLINLVQRLETHLQPLYLTHKLAKHITLDDKVHHIRIIRTQRGSLAVSVDDIIAESTESTDTPHLSYHYSIDSAHTLRLLGVANGRTNNNQPLINYPLPPNFIGCVGDIQFANESIYPLNDTLTRSYIIQTSSLFESGCSSHACRSYSNSINRKPNSNPSICPLGMECTEHKGDKLNEIWGDRSCLWPRKSIGNLDKILPPVVVGILLCGSLLGLLLFLMVRQKKRHEQNIMRQHHYNVKEQSNSMFIQTHSHPIPFFWPSSSSIRTKSRISSSRSSNGTKVNSADNNNTNMDNIINNRPDLIRSHDPPLLNPLIPPQHGSDLVFQPVFQCSHPDLYEDMGNGSILNEWHQSGHPLLMQTPNQCFTPSLTDDTLLRTYYSNSIQQNSSTEDIIPSQPLQQNHQPIIFTPTHSSPSSSSSNLSNCSVINNHSNISPQPSSWIKLQRVLPPPPPPDEQYDYANNT